jgi:3-oxoacyl-(acyl-carrier-protein) synthase
MQLKRVVVTGLGALTPIGNTVTEYWDALLNGVSGADFITKFDASKFKTRFACEVKNFEVTNFMDKKEARKMDLYTQYAMVVADEAVADAGITAENHNSDRVGVIWGSGIGGLITFQNECEEFFATSRWVYFFNKKENKESDRPYLNLIRNILQATKTEFFNKPCSFTLDNVKHTSVKYFIVL